MMWVRSAATVVILSEAKDLHPVVILSEAKDLHLC